MMRATLTRKSQKAEARRRSSKIWSDLETLREERRQSKAAPTTKRERVLEQLRARSLSTGGGALGRGARCDVHGNCKKPAEKFEAYKEKMEQPTCVSTAAFSLRSQTRLLAGLQLVKTFVIMLLIVGGSVAFNADAQVYVIGPIERMMALVEKLSENPLGATHLDLTYVFALDVTDRVSNFGRQFCDAEDSKGDFVDWAHADVLKVQASLHPLFRSTWKQGYEAFLSGDWSVARKQFNEASRLKPGDGPAAYLVSVMARFNDAPPRGWDGAHVLDGF